MSIETPRCSICGRPASYYQRYSGQYFCDKCFIRFFERKVARTISKYRMLRPREKIGIAVSGGKDSMVLLRVLSKLAPKHGSELHALIVDEGIESYREKGIRIAVEFSESLGIQAHIISFKEIYGYTLDELVAASTKTETKITPCRICGTLRRRALDVLALNAGVDVIATGHNLDDTVQSFIMNLLNGDVKRIAWLHPIAHGASEGYIRRVHPLIELLDEEILHYANVTKTPYQAEQCPYRELGQRSIIRRMINRLEENSPGTKHVLYSSALKIAEAISKQGYAKPPFKRCSICGWPSTSDPCSVCKTLSTVLRQPINSSKIKFRHAGARVGPGG